MRDMKLIKFRIRKYRNIQDSGEVELAGNLNCIVGKNQSGKTALLRALHKFNAHDKRETYKLGRDWPRGERRQTNPRQIVCEVTFQLSDEERTALSKLTSQDVGIAEVVVTRNYAGEFEVQFPASPELFPNRLHPNALDNLCQRLPPPPSPAGLAFGRLFRNAPRRFGS